MRLIVVLPLLLLGGCSWFSSEPRVQLEGDSIASILPEVRGNAVDLTPAPELQSLAGVIGAYERVLETLPAGRKQFEIRKRLVELRYLEVSSMDPALPTGSDTAPLPSLIGDIEALIPQAGASDGERGDLYYQLSRAYDQLGDRDALLRQLDHLIELSRDSSVELEARFRRAELRFTDADYRGALPDYTLVAAAQGRYRLHAGYMRAWTLFKLGRLDEALPPAIEVLSETHADDAQHAELQQDLMRMIVLALDYLDGPETLSVVMNSAGKPAWQVLLYRALGDWYQEKERYLDSAATWQTFIRDNPMHADAPGVFLEVIETQRLAGFVTELAALKLQFIERFDRRSSYFDVHGEAGFERYRKTLKEFLETHTSALHAAAQENHVPADFQLAATAYQRWLDNFAGDPREAEIIYLMAEALDDAGAGIAAIDRYREIAMRFPASDYGLRAAYAAVTGLESLTTVESPRSEQRLEANRRFVALFPDDPRAGVVQLKSAQILYAAADYGTAADQYKAAADQYKAAAGAAQQALDLGGLSPEAGRSALLIRSHSQFELTQYREAEGGYRELEMLHGPDPVIRDRLLASIFKQGQSLELQGALDLAIGHYERLATLDPDHPLGIASSFDVVSLWETLGQPAKAAKQLKTFLQRYPHSELATGKDQRLANLYEQSGQWQQAADHWQRVSIDDDATPDQKRQALYRAAELYRDGKDAAAAIRCFRDYAHTFSEPLVMQMEAMHQLDLLYQQTAVPVKRSFWLKKKVSTAMAAQTLDSRSRFLAAEAALVLAEADLEVFRGIALRQPLKRSLQQKRQVMNRAIEALEKVVTLGVAAPASAATFYMADVYASFAQALLTSERPPGLNELESEQYVLLLEEQAYPFEEKAIGLHEQNLRRGWRDAWDHSTGRSLLALAQLVPGKFRREEMEVAYAKVLN